MGGIIFVKGFCPGEPLKKSRHTKEHLIHAKRYYHAYWTTTIMLISNITTISGTMTSGSSRSSLAFFCVVF